MERSTLAVGKDVEEALPGRREVLDAVGTLDLVAIWVDFDPYRWRFEWIGCSGGLGMQSLSLPGGRHVFGSGGSWSLGASWVLVGLSQHVDGASR